MLNALTKFIVLKTLCSPRRVCVFLEQAKWVVAMMGVCLICIDSTN